MNFTPYSIEVEWLLALETLVLIVVQTSGFSLLALALCLAQIVLVSTLDAVPFRVVFVAELVLVDTGSVRSHDVVGVALSAVTLVGNQAVGELAHVEPEVVVGGAFLAASQEILGAAIDLARLAFRVEAERSSAGDASSINVVAPELFGLADTLAVEETALDALNASVRNVVGLTVGIGLVANSRVRGFVALVALHAFAVFHLDAVGQGASVVSADLET